MASVSPHAHHRTPHFFPSAALDRPALPITAPDPRKYLAGTNLPAMPFRLRLFVDRNGQVIEVRVLQPTGMEESTLRPVRDMFLDTLFVPGNLDGREVPSYLDVEIFLQDLAAPHSVVPLSTPL